MICWELAIIDTFPVFGGYAVDVSHASVGAALSSMTTRTIRG